MNEIQIFKIDWPLLIILQAFIQSNITGKQGRKQISQQNYLGKITAILMNKQFY